jgi:hypothetical protein
MKWVATSMFLYFGTCFVLILEAYYHIHQYGGWRPQDTWTAAMVLPVLLVIAGLSGVWAKAEWSEC